MKPAPQRPGESAAAFNARVKAMEDRFNNRPKGTKPGGMTPTPPKPTGPVRGMSPVKGQMPPKPRGMKSGGMVKGKKK